MSTYKIIWTDGDEMDLEACNPGQAVDRAFNIHGQVLLDESLDYTLWRLTQDGWVVIDYSGDCAGIPPEDGG